MKIGFVLFNGITFLDFIGFYDVIYRLNLFEETKGTTWDICGLSEEISDELGLTIVNAGIHLTHQRRNKIDPHVCLVSNRFRF